VLQFDAVLLTRSSWSGVLQDHASDARCAWSAIILQGISFSAIAFGLVRAFNESNGIEPSISSSSPTLPRRS